jgi:hypothetical protein
MVINTYIIYESLEGLSCYIIIGGVGVPMSLRHNGLSVVGIRGLSDDTDYTQPDALILNHPAVTNFLWSQGRTINYRAAFKNVKQAKSFCREHFNGLTTVPL